jgi:hypothetical protein
MSTHPDVDYLPKKDTQPWRILKLLSAKAPLTSTEIAAELSISTKLIVQALYVLAHRYNLVYQGKSMSGYLLTKKGIGIARCLGFSGGKALEEAPKAGGAVKRVAKRAATKRGSTNISDVVDDDLVRVIREQQNGGKRKGMRTKRMGVQAGAQVSSSVIAVAGAGGAGGSGGNAFALKHPDLVKERTACLLRVAAIDAYAEAYEKFRASSLGG